MRKACCLLVCAVCLFFFSWVNEDTHLEGGLSDTLQAASDAEYPLDYCYLPAGRVLFSQRVAPLPLRLLRFFLPVSAALLFFFPRKVHFLLSHRPARHRRCSISPMADNRGGHAPPHLRTALILLTEVYYYVVDLSVSRRISAFFSCRCLFLSVG